MSGSTTFSFTGFCDQSNQTFYKQSLIKLGCKYIQKLSQLTNILIVNATWTQKFKIAQLNESPIPCVSKKWIQDSNNKGYLQPLNKYLISEKELFLGTTVAICGFTAQKTQKIQGIIKERQGSTVTKYKACEVIRKYAQIPQCPHLILASEDQIQRAKYAKLPTTDEDVLPLVGLQWLEDSLSRKRCKYPNDYAVNLINIKAILRNLPKLRTKLSSFLVHDIMDKSGDFLQDTMIHIDKQCNMDLMKVFKNLISVCGGYWTDKFSSVVTHVLVAQTDEMKHNQYRKYGCRVHILRTEWLIDSIFLYNRLPEEDYKVRSFRINDQTIKNLIQEEMLRSNQNTHSFNSLPGMLDKKNSSSSNTLPWQFLTFKKKSISQPKTDIFRGRDFYMLPELISDPFYVQLKRTVQNAGGNIYDKINSKMRVYLPLRDSPKNKQIGQWMFLAKYKFLMVSPRWINQCVKKNCFIQPDLSVYLHFKAFDFNLPLPDFHKFVFDVVGCDSVSALRIREILPFLGSTKTNPNKAQITHIICGPEANSLQSKIKIMKIYNENKKVHLISSNWISECINMKKAVNPCNYTINILQQQMLNTPQKKSQYSQQNSNGNKTLETQSKATIKLTPQISDSFLK